MDGTIAVIFALIGLTDMTFNDCPTGCFSKNESQNRAWIQVGPTLVDSREIREVEGSEVTIGYDFGRSYGPFQPMASLGVSMEGDVWLGAGVKWRLEPGGTPIFFEGSFQPGFHFENDGPDLGGDVQFKSAIGIGYEFNNGGAVLLSFDHRSNADFHPETNPGMESVTIQYSMAFN